MNRAGLYMLLYHVEKNELKMNHFLLTRQEVDLSF
jgi:hypothetical protein